MAVAQQKIDMNSVIQALSDQIDGMENIGMGKLTAQNAQHLKAAGNTISGALNQLPTSPSLNAVNDALALSNQLMHAETRTQSPSRNAFTGAKPPQDASVLKQTPQGPHQTTEDDGFNI